MRGVVNDILSLFIKKSTDREISMENVQQNRESGHPMAKVLSLIVLYIFLTFSSQYNQRQSHHGLSIAQKIKNNFQQLKINDLTSVYQLDEVYTGTWHNTSPNIDKADLPLTSPEGDFRLTITKIALNNKHQRFILTLSLINGQYIDKGVFQMNLILQSDNLTSVRAQPNTIALTLKDNKSIDTSFLFTKLLLAQNQGPVTLSTFIFGFSRAHEDRLQATITLSFSDNDFQLKIQDHEPRLMKLIIFAVLIFVVSYTPFTAALHLLKNILEGRDNPLHHSLITITIATMWDTVLCLVSFKVAFADQESLVMFILPAFMLCLLFTNLEPRLMLIIYERNQVAGQERRCFNFNLLSYGSLMALYPILIFTNFNRIFFIGISCLFFPQIYLNALRGIRPDPYSSYHLKFLLTRFLIIFYLRCFPFNVFAMEPDYTLTILCLSLLIFQFSLLNLQKKYGPKIVVPKWLLEPVFDYSYEQAVNLEESAQDHECAICLISLRKNPPDEEGELPFRLMKTPCKHNYHSNCLISWMKIKMECPQCRSVLPPYE